MVVADSHRPTTLAAKHQALKQSRIFARGTGFTFLLSTRLAVVEQALLMGQELLPGQVAWMSLLLEKAPLFSGQLAAVPGARGVFPGAGAAKTEGARIARVVQRVQRDGVRHFQPNDLPRTGLAALGELPAFASKRLPRGPGRAGPL